MSGRNPPRHNQIGSQTFRIITQYGDMVVVRQGIQHQPASEQPQVLNQQQQQQHQQQQQQQHSTRPIIMTFHDLGLNSELQFAKFCETDEVKLMLQTFTMLHVNFIGQEATATAPPSPRHQQDQAAPVNNNTQNSNLPEGFRYPSVEQMAECIVDVCTQLRVRSFIALAVGAGAHVVSSLALMRPDLVDGLFLINPVVSSCSITEWLYFKMSAITNQHHHHNHHHHQHNHQQQQQHQGSHSPSSEHQASGLRKLLTHIHLPHRTGSGSSAAQEEAAVEAADGGRRPEEPDRVSLQSSGSSGSSLSKPAASEPAPGSRLRRLILSRSIRTVAREQQVQAQEQQEPSAGEGLVGQCRPPYEYLMYHHFGPSSFQRYRRSSDTPTLRPSNSGDSPHSLAESGSQHSSPASQRARANSLTLSASYLASFPSDRQRHAYMQSVYRNHFGRINAHNLWLFAQSFAKRRALNLRKDCGAAAHAAAAAAALGTSICTAFVGLAPAGASRADESERQPTDRQLLQQQHQQQHHSAGQDKEQRPSHKQALVAGTKVKRTFTCQTLIMCSCTQMHCERAFKLMSLLNPLQATWIKTDQLLVLEERPDKVCQALRLFLQGIGYSMSTYERRLRLNSAPGSTGSNDSCGSLRSLNPPPPPPPQQQQQRPDEQPQAS